MYILCLFFGTSYLSQLKAGKVIKPGIMLMRTQQPTLHLPGVTNVADCWFGFAGRSPVGLAENGPITNFRSGSSVYRQPTATGHLGFRLPEVPSSQYIEGGHVRISTPSVANQRQVKCKTIIHLMICNHFCLSQG